MNDPRLQDDHDRQGKRPKPKPGKKPKKTPGQPCAVEIPQEMPLRSNVAKGPSGPPTVSPYIQSFEDYVGRAIRITVSFDTTTGALTDIVVFRAAGCLFTKILIGVGPDGAPDSSIRAVNVPAGTTDLTAPQMAALSALGLGTIAEFYSYQITAGR